MNIENIDKTIKTIEHHQKVADIFFDMGMFIDTHHTCGTAACIGGFAAIAAKGDKIKKVFKSDKAPETIGQRFLDLDDETAHDLFYPTGLEYGFSATAKDAIKVLEHLKKTGKVKWSVVNPDPIKRDKAMRKFLKKRNVND
jgi:hypothetical protein